MMRLKEARELTGMTQKEVTRRTGIALGTLRRGERGVNEPDTDSIVMLADLYGVSTDMILGSRFAQGNTPQLSDDEREMIEIMRELDEVEHAVLMKVARSLRPLHRGD